MILRNALNDTRTDTPATDAPTMLAPPVRPLTPALTRDAWESMIDAIDDTSSFAFESGARFFD